MSTPKKKFAQADLKPAAKLADAIYLFNPQKSLEGEQIYAFYVDRGSNARQQMRIYLETSDLARSEPVKLLFTGHTGSGKSTELNKLLEELGGKFFVVKVSTRTLVQPTDLTYVDIVLIAAMSLFRVAAEQKAIDKAPAQLVSDLWQDLQGFIRTRVFGSLPYREPAETVEVGAKVAYLAVEFEAKYRNEASSRDQIRQRMEDQLSEVIDRVNNLAALVRKNTRRPVLFVFDDTDKPDPARGRQIFFDHPTALTAFEASAIYTFNIALWYSREFIGVRDYFGQPLQLPNIKLKDRAGQNQPMGWEKMEAVLNTRALHSLISDEARSALIEKSGGLLRSLIGMTQFSAVNALGRGADKIELRDVQRAISERRNDFIAALEEKDYAILAARYRDKRLSSDSAVQELLQTQALLQYENDDAWCDVHPLVVDLLQERTQP